MVHTSHGETSDEKPNVSSADHDDLTAVRAFSSPGVFVLPGCPDAHAEDEQIEDDDGHDALCVDGHNATQKLRIKESKPEGQRVRFLPHRSDLCTNYVIF